jgi:hypothetical protein
MNATPTIAHIKQEATQAAQHYTNVLDACPYPLASDAGQLFQLHFQVALDLKKQGATA